MTTIDKILCYNEIVENNYSHRKDIQAGDDWMNIGLALAGGGGKGAYQIGVWKAMEEFGYKANAVAGTSVGALNAALYTQGNLDTAISLWENINPEDVLKIEIKNNLGFDLSLKEKGFFSQQGLINMIKSNIDFEKIRSSEVQFYAATHKKLKDEIKYFHVNEYDDETIVKILLASSSLPKVFDDIEIEGEIYDDGGGSILGAISNQLLEKKHAYDNNPIRPLYNQKLDFIIWAALDREAMINHSLFPNVRILPIIPRQSLGGLIDGTLDFSGAGAKKRIEQGYHDAVAAFKNIQGFLLDETQYQRLWEEIKDFDASRKEHSQSISRDEKSRTEIKEMIEKFNKSILDTDFTENDEKMLIQSYRNPMLEADHALINSIDRRLIDSFIEDYAAKSKDQSSEYQTALMDAVSYIAPVKSLSQEQKEKGFIKALFDRFTGKTDKAAFTNGEKLALAQESIMQLIKVMNSKNLTTLELTAAMNNKLSRAYYEISELGMAVNEQYMQIYSTISVMFQKLRGKIISDSERLTAHEDRLSRLEWLATLPVATYCGTEYRQLADEKKLICIINDFYRLTEGLWTQKELLILKQAMLDIELYDKKISPKSFKNILLKDKTIMTRLSEGLTGGRELYPMDIEAGETLEIPSFNFALEALYTLKALGYKPLKYENLEGVKKDCTLYLDEMKKICSENSLSEELTKEIYSVSKDIEAFRIKVPLIGIFSSGKSTLLNKYMQLELLNYDITPESSLAVELQYAFEEEQIKAHMEDGSTRLYPIDSMRNIKSMAEDMLYCELHIKSSVLKNHPDIVMVDMPGINSNYKHHNKAIANYIAKGCFYIVCISAAEGIPASLLSFLQEMNIYSQDNISFLVTKTDKMLPGEIHGQMEYIKEQLAGLGFNAPVIERIAAVDGDMQGFQNIIEHITQKKDGIFKAQLMPQINSIKTKIEYSLKLLINDTSYSYDELRAKADELAGKNAELLSRITSEKQRADSQISSIAEGIANDVYTVLMQMKYTLISEIKAGINIEERIKGIVQNTYQIALKSRLQLLLQQVMQSVNRYVEQEIYMSDTGDASAVFEGINSEAGFNPIIAGGIGAFIGMIILGPIGGIIGGLLSGIFADKDRERQIEEQLTNSFESIKGSMASQSKANISKAIAAFFAELDKKAELIKAQNDHDIKLLSDRINENQEKRKKQQQKLEAALNHMKNLSDGRDKNVSIKQIEG